MSVRYKKVQNKMEESKNYGKWFARVVTLGTVTTDSLAEELSHSTTVTRADIMAVLIELAEAMKRHLLNSQSVHLDGIGSFRVGIRSTATETEKEFKADKIKGFRIIYAPERSHVANVVDSNGKNLKVYVKDLLNGVTAEEMPASDKDKNATGDNGGTTGGDSGTGSQESEPQNNG